MNEKLNIPPFYVGQKIVCVIPDYDGDIKKGEIYTVMGLTFGNKGVELKEAKSSTSGSGFWYWRFVPAQESKFRSVSFEKVMEETEIICEN